MTLSEAARALGVRSSEYVRRLVQAGTTEAAKVPLEDRAGWRWDVSPEAVAAYVDRRESRGSKPKAVAPSDRARKVLDDAGF